MKIPLVDLKSQYLSIKKEIDEAIQKVLNQTAFIKGDFVEDFEQKYCQKYGVRHCIGVGNGTDALYISLKILGIKPGDEVITVANSWISSSETIIQAGATPVFVDIEPDYFTINPEEIKKRITSNTKVIMPVHLYGQSANMVKLKEICDRHNLFLIEDCAQAHFAEFKKQKVGTFGDLGTFSFFPGKNLGAYGDAGAIITNNDDLAEKVRMFANHGSLKKNEHRTEGVNSRLDGIQAAILKLKLKYIDSWTEERINNSKIYNDFLENIKEIELPKVRPNTKHVFHLYVIRAKNRDNLKNFLEDKGISTAIHYPCILPLLQIYQDLGYSKEEFLVSHKYQKEILSLPMYPELTKNQIKYIAEQIREFYCHFNKK